MGGYGHKNIGMESFPWVLPIIGLH